MPSEARRWRGALVALAVLATLGAAAGAPVPATRRAQVSGDEPQYLLSALSVAQDGSLDIADELAAGRWRDFHAAPLPQQTRPLPRAEEGPARQVSPHGPLLPLLLAGPAATGGWLGAKLVMAVLAGALAALSAWVAARMGVDRWLAVAVVALFALSPPLAVYGTQLYPELPAALCVTVAVAALATDPPSGRRARWLAGAAVVALPWLAVKYVPVAATLAAAVLARAWQGSERRAAADLALALGVAAAVFAAVHLALYTGLTPYAAGDHFVGGELTAVGSAPDYWGRTRRLVGLLVDRHFGLAAWQPAYLLVVPAAAWLLRRRGPHALLLLGPLAAGWLVATFLALTMHGWWFPGRQLVVVLPLAVVAVARWAQDWAPARGAVTGLGALGVASYAWLVADGLRGHVNWVVDFTATAGPVYRMWSALLPAYLRPDARAWALHAAWAAAAGAAALWTWRRAGSPE